MATKKINPEQLGEALNEIIDEYAHRVVNDSKDELLAIGKLTVKTAQAYASRIGRGRYAKSLSMQEEADSGRAYMGARVQIYSKQYRIAHLLEHGHTKVSRTGKPLGMTKAFPHFAPAEKLAVSMLEQRIKQVIQRS